MNNTFLLMLTTILLTTFLLTSCHKNTIKPNTSASEYFPNSVGDYWEYNVYDSSDVLLHPTTSRNYTVKVSIIGTQKLVDNKDATVWQYQYPWGKELNYVRISGDTVKIYDTVYSKTLHDLEFPREIYIMPYYDNEIWNGKLLWVDNYTANNVANILSAGNQFDSCFFIFHHYEGPNIEYNDSYWFKSNIGIVKKYKHQYSLGPLDIELWELKNYYLR